MPANGHTKYLITYRGGIDDRNLFSRQFTVPRSYSWEKVVQAFIEAERTGNIYMAYGNLEPGESTAFLVTSLEVGFAEARTTVVEVTKGAPPVPPPTTDTVVAKKNLGKAILP